MPPDERSKALLQRVDEVLDLIHLHAHCARIGDVIPTGSYFLDAPGGINSEFTTPYFYFWLSRGHIVEIAAANNFGNERTNTRTGNRMHEATVKYYPYPSLIKFYGEHAEEEGDHANLGAYVLKNYATTDDLQRKATLAAKKSSR